MRKRSVLYFTLFAAVEAGFFLFFLLLAMYQEDAAALWQNAPGVYMLYCLLCCGIAAAVCSFLFSARLVAPLSDMEKLSEYPELQPLLRRLASHRSGERHNMAEAEKKDSSLRLIMENISEGLVIMDGAGVVLNMNKGAERLLLPPGQSGIGKQMFAFCRNSALQAAVHMAIGGVGDEARFQLQDRAIHAIANPVVTASGSKGVVLFLLDITREYAAEQMRREFSANVSHELKTPLTSISGYAELMENGMVAPEDVARFAGNIHRESQRMLALINDIIRLSRLDEGEIENAFQEVELLELAELVVLRLQKKAENRRIALRATGEPATILGEPGLLEEMFFNLCDNAIIYNRPGGWAEISVHPEGNDVVVTVQDNGIGIPHEHQPRVFERFYRVDKSHSRQTGGTGLGLSIVKHGAALHQALLQLESQVGKGTKISVRFGKNVD